MNNSGYVNHICLLDITKYSTDVSCAPCCLLSYMRPRIIAILTKCKYIHKHSIVCVIYTPDRTNKHISFDMYRVYWFFGNDDDYNANDIKNDNSKINGNSNHYNTNNN